MQTFIGDSLVVLPIMEQLAEAKAGFRSLTEAIDTTTPAGRMMMRFFLVLEGAPGGLSWSTVVKKRDGYRRARQLIRS